MSCLQHVCSSGQRTLMCNTSSTYHVNTIWWSCHTPWYPFEYLMFVMTRYRCYVLAETSDITDLIYDILYRYAWAMLCWSNVWNIILICGGYVMPCIICNMKLTSMGYDIHSDISWTIYFILIYIGSVIVSIIHTDINRLLLFLTLYILLYM